MLWLLKNWKITLPILAALSLLGAFWYHGHNEYGKGYQRATDVCQIEKQRQTEIIIDKRKEMNNARNNAPSASAIDNILRNGQL